MAENEHPDDDNTPVSPESGEAAPRKTGSRRTTKPKHVDEVVAEQAATGDAAAERQEQIQRRLDELGVSPGAHPLQRGTTLADRVYKAVVVLGVLFVAWVLVKGNWHVGKTESTSAPTSQFATPVAPVESEAGQPAGAGGETSVPPTESTTEPPRPARLGMMYAPRPGRMPYYGTMPHQPMYGGAPGYYAPSPYGYAPPAGQAQAQGQSSTQSPAPGTMPPPAYGYRGPYAPYGYYPPPYYPPYGGYPPPQR